MATWCSGIISASHAEGPGFKSQCVHCLRGIAFPCIRGETRWVHATEVHRLLWPSTISDMSNSYTHCTPVGACMLCIGCSKSMHLVTLPMLVLFMLIVTLGQAGPLKGAVGHLITILVQWDLRVCMPISGMLWELCTWIAAPGLEVIGF